MALKKNPNIKKIYFDMDGVLADFDKGLKDLLGIDPMPQDNQPEEYQERMWQGIKDYGHFYFDLEPMEGALSAFKEIYDTYGDACEILTGIPKEKRGIIHAKNDKIEWVRKYLSKDMKINAILRKDKINYCEGEDCVLIDDFTVNTDEWTNAGGTAIVFTSWEDVLNKLSW